MEILDFNTMDIRGDEKVIARATAAGVALDTVDITEHRLDADVLAGLWHEADRRIDDESALTYAAVKAAIKAAHE